jgi:hypothetical protein
MGMLFVKCIVFSDVWRSQVPNSEIISTYASAVKHMKS